MRFAQRRQIRHLLEALAAVIDPDSATDADLRSGGGGTDAIIARQNSSLSGVAGRTASAT
jgi:hypothetical protein